MTGYAIGNYQFSAYGQPAAATSKWSWVWVPAAILGTVYIAATLMSDSATIAPEHAPQYALDAARRKRL